MRRTFAALLAVALTLLLGLGPVGSGPASADDTAKPAAPGKDKGAAVGLRTATAKGGDRRGKYEYEIPPRGRIVDYVAVSNLRYEPITVRLFAKDATTTSDSPFAVQESNEKPEDVGAWTSIKKPRITIPARSEIVVPFQVGVPADATPGDHAGSIVVSLLAREPKPKGGTIVVDHRIGLRLLLRVPGDYKPALTVTGLKASWDSPGTALGRGDAVVTYTVRNTGNLRVSATGSLELTRMLGLPAVEARTAPITEIQPGGEMKVRQVVSGVLGSGPMKAHLTLHPKPVDPKLQEVPVKNVSKAVGFQAWPWILIAIAAAALLLGGAGGWYGRRRRRARKAAMQPTGGSHRAAASPDTRPEPNILVRIAVGAAAAVLAVLVLGPPAYADTVDVWQGKPSIQQGTDNTPFDMVTTGGCPLPGTNAVGFAYGRGFPKGGGAIIGNGDAGVEARGPFDMPLAGSMQQLMSQQPEPTVLSGVYKIELRCVSPDLQETTGTYVFAIRFSDAHHWRAMPPLTTKKGPNTTGSDKPGSSDPQNPSAGSNPGANGGANGSSGQPSTEAETQQAQEQAQQRAEQLSGVQAKETASSGGPSWPLIGGGLAALTATALYLTRRARA